VNSYKYYHSAYIKVGKFFSDTDLVTDDVIERNLFEQFEMIFKILHVKYLRLLVKGYADWRRIEEYEYPEDAMREAILNALIHKDYTGSHTQMKIYPNKIICNYSPNSNYSPNKKEFEFSLFYHACPGRPGK